MIGTSVKIYKIQFFSYIPLHYSNTAMKSMAKLKTIKSGIFRYEILQKYPLE